MPLPLVCPTPLTRNNSFDSSASDDCDPSISVVIGGFKLLKQLGSGSAGDVYVASKGGELLALKVLTPRRATAEFAARFEREARLTCGVGRHPNICTGVEWGFVEASGCSYLAMELAQGMSLQQMMQEQGRLEWSQACRIICQIAQALAHLAEHGIVHRDLKPANIIVDPSSGTARLIDLGLARAVSEVDEERGDQSKCAPDIRTTARNSMSRIQTMEGCAIGSPAYMAPEQVCDARSSTAAADVYGLGATWYVAMTGRLPFDGNSPQAVMQQVLQGHVVPPTRLVPTLPAAVEALVLWAMERDPSMRPRSARSLERQIHIVITHPHDVARVQRARAAEAAALRSGANMEYLWWVGAAMAALSMIAWLTMAMLDLAPALEEPIADAATVASS